MKLSCSDVVVVVIPQVAANWKILVENYLEYYHLPAVHPELCDVSGVDEHRRSQVTLSHTLTRDPRPHASQPLQPHSPASALT